MELSIRKLNPKAMLPTYATDGSAGADLYALLEAPVTILPGTTVMIPTGLAMALPEGYAGLIYPRSGLASKRGLAPANKVGVIDPDYRGEVKVALHNHGAEPQTVSDGERIAQLVVTPFLHVNFVETDVLDETERGEGGFGSTGITAIHTPLPEETDGESTEEEARCAASPLSQEELPDMGTSDEEATLSDTPAAEAHTPKEDTPEGITREALTFYHGLGAPFDRKKAVKLLTMAADRGEVLARSRLAYLTCIGDEIAGIKQDAEKGKEILASLLPLLRNMARGGDLEAMLMMGNALAEGLGTPKNTRRAFEYFYDAAEGGYAPAFNAMGQCYNAGVGVQPDVIRSVASFRRSAEMGFAPGQFNLGISYFNGKGIKQDKVEAANWYAKAAEQGYAPAQFLLGKHYSQIMNGVENDPQKGLEWLTRSADQGYMKAIIYMADIYHNAGNEEGDRRAAKWYTVAAKRGNAYALYRLSCYAYVGRGGVRKDLKAADTLLRRAVELGDKDAERRYRDLHPAEP